jgi:Fe2+ or Zn2+ uptake regulation protein/O6-methylguanine-DNA--protein-cysteine methyltransferase
LSCLPTLDAVTQNFLNRQNENMTLTPDTAGEMLRARGMRSTPQRRAILSVFGGGRAEHLSADEVYARASRSLPELSRGTVYATLAEFSELGLLSAFGSPEPVRYETNVAPHAHFRCRLCSRLFDLAAGQQGPDDITDPGFIIERVETRAEGICDECSGYGAGLTSGARAIRKAGPPGDTLHVAGAAACEITTPLGTVFLAATPKGLTRLAFEDHADADALRAHATSRRGSRAAREHLTQATASLQRYFAGELPRPVCAIDWDHVHVPVGPLTSTEAVPYATHRSYSELDANLSAHDLGYLFGANPIPLFMPCHRVSRGVEIPTQFVGGTARRTWLLNHERTHPLA